MGISAYPGAFIGCVIRMFPGPGGIKGVAEITLGGRHLKDNRLQAGSLGGERPVIDLTVLCTRARDVGNWLEQRLADCDV